MTNSRDKRDGRQSDRDRSKGESSEYATGSRSAQFEAGDGTGENSNIDSPLTVEETIQLTADQTDEVIEEERTPSLSVADVNPASGRGASVSVGRHAESLGTSVRPKAGVSKQESTVAVQELTVRRVTELAASDTRPSHTQKTGKSDLALPTRSVSVGRTVERIERRTRPATTLSQARVQGSQTLLDEIEEIDPVFGWTGGQPYGDSRPTLILHYDEGHVQSFSFLQRCLRDTYAELEGGEPVVEQVEFVANEPQVSNVSGRIISLDLTEGEWTPSISGGRPKIERGGVDVVPMLKEKVQTLYSGGLGFFIVNIPTNWEGPVRRAGFFNTLIEYITGGPTPDSSETEDIGVIQKLSNVPVTIARPRIEETDTFDARVAQYFGFDRVPEWETLSQADAAFVNMLRSERWGQIALTERQAEGDESSRHYNSKGLITDGIAREIWGSRESDNRPFQTFASDELLGEDVLLTEFPVGDESAEDAGVIADIYINDINDVSQEDVESFLPQEDSGLPFAIEFETGFSEGAFQHRKIVESIEKYERVESVTGTVALVIPPRLLYRGRRQANLFKQLVRTEAEQLEQTNVMLCIPVLSDGTCVGFRTANDVIEALYDND